MLQSRHSIICPSGLIGFRASLHDIYEGSLERYQELARVYNLPERAGFASAEDAWDQNPWIESSVEPSDYRAVPKAERFEPWRFGMNTRIFMRGIYDLLVDPQQDEDHSPIIKNGYKFRSGLILFRCSLINWGTLRCKSTGSLWDKEKDSFWLRRHHRKSYTKMWQISQPKNILET